MRTSLFIRKNGRYVRLHLHEILFIEGCRNYLKIITESGAHLVLLTFKKMEELLDQEMFLRIHKSYIVAVDKIDAFCSDTVMVHNKTLPIGHYYKGRLEKRVTILSEEAVSDITDPPGSCVPQKLLAV